MLKILIADTYYPDFLKSIPFDASSTYEVELQKVLDYKFGTFDAYSQNLRALGHECVDVIANCLPLQQQWQREHCDRQVFGGTIFDSQIYQFNPDVVFLQDLSLRPRFVTRPAIIAAQCSCAFNDEDAKRCDVIFTSLPTHVPRIKALGVRAVYLPLAFEPSVLQGPQPERDIEISFVGGVGRNSHWKQGTDVLEAVADAFKERFHWYGYGLDNLSASSPLRACYRGEAWGRAMYDVYRRSKIVINRHGEVAQGYANNLRMYEATGCGAVLVTESSPNLSKMFSVTERVEYESPEEAVALIRFYLDDDDGPGYVSEIARRGQRRTLRDHTYAQRMKVVSETLTEMLCPA